MPSNGWLLSGGAVVWLIWAAVVVFGAARAARHDSATFKSLFGMRGLQLLLAPLLVVSLVVVFLMKLIPGEAFLGLLGGAFGFIFGKATSRSE